MTDDSEDPRVSWYDITIAGKQFSIASRRGEAHIRGVERLIEETMAELTGKVQGQTQINLALLTALNLADRLVSHETDRNAGASRWEGQLKRMVERLSQAVPDPYGPLDSVGKEGTTAVFD